METREHPRIKPGLEVFDAGGRRVGTVSHLHESSASGDGDSGSVFEMKTGLFGLGKHYYIPYRAVNDVTTGGVFLKRFKADFDALGWGNKLQAVSRPDEPGAIITPGRADDVVRPDEGAPPAAGREREGTPGGTG